MAKTSDAQPAVRWRRTAIASVLLLHVAWLTLGLAYLTQPATSSSLTPKAMNYRVHVNEDDAVKLQLLSGVGHRLAERIVSRREKLGLFKHRGELEAVHRIGPRVLDRIEPWIDFAPHTPVEP